MAMLALDLDEFDEEELFAIDHSVTLLDTYANAIEDMADIDPEHPLFVFETRGPRKCV